LRRAAKSIANEDYFGKGVESRHILATGAILAGKLMFVILLRLKIF
jgi:hypothetical protein